MDHIPSLAWRWIKREISTERPKAVAWGAPAGYLSCPHSGSGWSATPLHPFDNLNDGQWPSGALIVDAGGNVFGELDTVEGGGCCGRLYVLEPPQNGARAVVDPWSETLLHRFTGAPDGDKPAGPLTLDAAGAIYLTTQFGGQFDQGAVVKLSPSGGGWTETILYSFLGKGDGAQPMGGVILDKAGNLYGTTLVYGTVFQLTPSGSGWTKSTLYNFQGGNDGAGPMTGVVRDDSGNLYGTTTLDGADGWGTVFELSPMNGDWTFTVLYESPRTLSARGVSFAFVLGRLRQPLAFPHAYCCRGDRLAQSALVAHSLYRRPRPPRRPHGNQS